jgi:hypothetical protein
MYFVITYFWVIPKKKYKKNTKKSKILLKNITVKRGC